MDIVFLVPFYDSPVVWTAPEFIVFRVPFYDSPVLWTHCISCTISWLPSVMDSLYFLYHFLTPQCYGQHRSSCAASNRSTGVLRETCTVLVLSLRKSLTEPLPLIPTGQHWTQKVGSFGIIVEEIINRALPLIPTEQHSTQKVGSFGIIVEEIINRAPPYDSYRATLDPKGG